MGLGRRSDWRNTVSGFGLDSSRRVKQIISGALGRIDLGQGDGPWQQILNRRRL